jgi:hypothetical protein
MKTIFFFLFFILVDQKRPKNTNKINLKKNNLNFNKKKQNKTTI